MVDTTIGVSQLQSISSVNKTQNSENKRSEDTRESREVQDSVEISSEALSLADAEQTAQETRVALAQDQSQSLGLDPSFDEDA